MGLYLGSSEKLRISSTIGSIIGACRLNIPTLSPITNSIRLLSFDNYTLQDSNGIYLTVKEDN